MAYLQGQESTEDGVMITLVDEWLWHMVKSVLTRGPKTFRTGPAKKAEKAKTP